MALRDAGKLTLRILASLWDANGSEELIVKTYEKKCVVEDEPPDCEIVRHAHPIDEDSIARIREQQIERLAYDGEAVTKRERAIAIKRGRITEIRRRVSRLS